MTRQELKEQVYEANMELQRRGLVVYTFGNVSQIDREQGIIAIKPSGVPYDKLKANDMVLLDLENQVIDSTLKPSSDTKTHTFLYRLRPDIGGICHTHSRYATAWAQAQKPLPCFGTTHADYIHGDIPCTALISDEQVTRDYEEETGVQIADCLWEKKNQDVSMVLVAGHGPFTWGVDAAESVYHAVILEELAHMALLTLSIAPETGPLKQTIRDKHYQRKHGKNAYYGQK